MKGIFEFEVGEPKAKRGFKFGTYAFAVACEKDKSTLSQLLKKIGVGESPGASVDVMSLLNLFYGAAVHYAKHKKTEIDFNDSDVSDWIDELGIDQVNRFLVEGFQQYAPKNSNSPKENGEMILQ
jgi:hypothetical protein